MVCQTDSVRIEPRPIDAAERGVLAFLLGVDFPEAEKLRAQIDGLMVVGRCDCGCPTVDLAPASDAIPAKEGDWRLVPSEARITPIGDEPPADVIAFVDEGFLSGLELVTYVGDPPEEWPPLDRFEHRV